MKVRVYFCREPAGAELVHARISRQALDTIYDLVWEHELKNVITIGKVWLRFRQSGEKPPFGHPLKEKRPHATIAAGDIIEAAGRSYMVMDIGVKEIELENEE